MRVKHIRVNYHSAINRNLYRYVQYHHHRKTCGKKDRSYIGMLPLAHFRDQLFHHHVKHGAGRKTKEIQQERDNITYGKYFSFRPSLFPRQHRNPRLVYVVDCLYRGKTGTSQGLLYFLRGI